MPYSDEPCQVQNRENQFRQRRKIYLADRNALVFLTPEAVDSNYWDDIWRQRDLKLAHRNPRNRLMESLTAKYLPSRSGRILEAGCGIGTNVRVLRSLGYDCRGIDYAPHVIDSVKEIFPELPLELGDVRRIPFEDGSFDAYWSVGVIEHFETPCQEVTSEAFRILRQKGYAFVSFPYLCPVRRLKRFLGCYERRFGFAQEFRKHFNQYALDPSAVVRQFEAAGFRFLQGRTYNGLLGWIEEVPLAKGWMKKLYGSRRKWLKGPRYFLNGVLSSMMSHCIILVFEKPQTRIAKVGRSQKR
jgi:SAM-dependent methyltransferase